MNEYEAMSHESGGICWCGPGEPHGPEKRVSRETFATSTRISPRHFQAYCTPCGDGINTHRRVAADEWASDHNRDKHGDSK